MTNSKSLRGCIGLAAMAAVVSVVMPLQAGIPGSVPGKATGVSPASAPFGKSYDLLSQQWWLWDLMQAAPDNPTLGAPCANGQSGNVWFLYGGPATVDCTIPAGKMLFFPIVNTECSSLEAAPFHGDTPEQRAACAKGWIDFVTDVAVTIDGKPIQNLSPLRTRSGDFSFTVPNNNILGVPGPAWGYSSADGYYVLLTPLSAGEHTIHVQGTFHDPNDPSHPVIFPLNTTMHLHVQ
jgi:hypothetical protein